MKYSSLLGASLVFVGAVLFSAKAIFVKLAYQYTIDPVSLLTLRMVFSLPFFLAIAFLTSNKKENLFLQKKDWFHILLLGMVGYYLASLFDFQGLQYITAGLERLILFIYPTIVVVIAAILYKRPIKRVQYMALIMSYIGIFIAFAFDLNLRKQPNIGLGALLIFLSALTYAIYLIGSGKMIPKVGTMRFTAYAMSFSAFAIIIHSYFFNRLALWDFNREVYIISALMAVFSTVIPSFLISGGIKLIGSDNASIVGSVGPVSTIVLAYIFLNESVSTSQIVGTVFVLAGVLIISLKKEPIVKPNVVINNQK